MTGDSPLGRVLRIFNTLTTGAMILTFILFGAPNWSSDTRWWIITVGLGILFGIMLVALYRSTVG